MTEIPSSSSQSPADEDTGPSSVEEPAPRRSPWRLKPLHSMSDDHRYTPMDNNAGNIEMTTMSSSGMPSEDGRDGLVVMPSLEQQHQEASSNKLPRHLTLLDLVSVGVGGTVGSGIFVLCGLIASQHAGPATCLSWCISGAAALLSGCCYAELSGRIPSAGSSYAYAYASMGELPAFVTAACLTLEFLVSGSAVARSWGDKVVEWLKIEMEAGDWVDKYLDPGASVNPMAFVVASLSTALILCGVRESKIMTDFFTWTKVALVIFMTVGGFVLWNPSNLKPFVPSEFGFSGVIRGATTSFFGYLGFDGICCVAGEAKNPTINLPRSVMITLAIVTVLYVSAALALVGMQHYTEISSESAFPEAFKANGLSWAAQLSATGEICTLPVVVWISVILQPRLQYALARDGLLPRMFCELDEKGNIRKGSLFAGSLMTLIATFVPFEYLDDFISAGILVAFSVTNSSLIVMRLDSSESHPFLLEKLLLGFNLLSFISCLILTHGDLASKAGMSLAIGFVLATVSTGCVIFITCPACRVFGGRRAVGAHWDESVRYFQTPFVPTVPLLGTFFNWYLISDLDIWGIVLLLLYFCLVVAAYYLYVAKISVPVRNYQVVGRLEDHEDANNEGGSESNGVQSGQIS